MDLKTKHRIVGSVVVIACVAIFIPIFFHRDLPQDKILSLSSKIPAPPSEPVYQTTESGVKFSFDSAEVKEKAPELAAMVNTNKQPRPKPTVSESKPKLKAKTTIATTTTKTKTKTVVAEVKPALAIDAAPKAWVVQLGTFADKANVDRLVQKLRTAGYEIGRASCRERV